MDYIRVTKENIDRGALICCAMSGKQSLAKKEWLKQRFEEGLVLPQCRAGQMLYRVHPGRKRMGAIDAAGWLYINCLWVSGSLKVTAIPAICWKNASGCQGAGQNSVCILCAEGANGSFSPTPSF